MYLATTPWFLRAWHNKQLIWQGPPTDNTIYLTFDDGPHQEITHFVTDTLKTYRASATFFCVGSRVEQYPELYAHLQQAGFTTGNHSFNHLNGWKTKTDQYIADIVRAASVMPDNRLFRPPYGRITRTQAAMLLAAEPAWKICMWSILSGDFDQKISSEKCLQNVLYNLKPGNIVVFHDSEKAYRHLKFVLPRVLQHCAEKGYHCAPLPY